MQQCDCRKGRGDRKRGVSEWKQQRVRCNSKPSLFLSLDRDQMNKVALGGGNVKIRSGSQGLKSKNNFMQGTQTFDGEEFDWVKQPAHHTFKEPNSQSNTDHLASKMAPEEFEYSEIRIPSP